MGIAMNYCAGYIRQQENQQLGLPRETVDRFSPRLRELVGYGVYNMLIGHINKQSPEHLLLDRAPEPEARRRRQPHGVGSDLNVLRHRRQRRRAAAHARPARRAERVRHAALRRVRARVSRGEHARDDIACVVLTGNGRAFSAGQDLGEWSHIDPSAASAPDDPGPGFPRFIDTVAAFEKPLIAAVNGLGVGIGLTVLLHCDLVLIARGARLRAPFVPLGVVPEAAGSLMMPVVMGGQRAALALYTGEWITAEDAVACGLALRIVEPDALLPDTLELAGRIARMPVSSLVETKRLVLAGRIDAVRAARAREDQAFAAHGRSTRQPRGAHRVPREARTRLPGARSQPRRTRRSRSSDHRRNSQWKNRGLRAATACSCSADPVRRAARRPAPIPPARP